MRFYVLDEPKSGSPEDLAGGIDAMPIEGANYGPGPRCKRCNRPLGSKTWLPPYQLELEAWGERYGDIRRWGNDLIVSERFREAFEQAGLQGLESFEPVEIIKVIHRRGKPKEAMPDYFKATIVRSSTMIDQQASGYVWEDESRVCPECLFDSLADLKRCKRLVVKQDTWNGDDLFFPRGGTRLIVSERFLSMFHDQQLLGAIFIPSESDEAGYDSFPWETEAEAKG